MRLVAAALVLLPLVQVSSSIPGARAAGEDNAALAWNDAAVRGLLVHDWEGAPSSLNTPEFARILAILNTCMYDAWAAYDPVAVGTTPGWSLRRPPAERTEDNRTQAVSFAAYRALYELIPSGASIDQALMSSYGFDPANTTVDPSTPAGVGNVACRDVLGSRHQDGSNQLAGYADYTGYTPVNRPMVVTAPLDPSTVKDPNRWQPLTHVDSLGRTTTPRADVPFWSKVTPFALSSASQFRSASVPAKAGSLGFIKQAVELVLDSALLTDQQKMIAEYWSDGPGSALPPGHWDEIGQFVSRRDNHSLEQDVKMFLTLSNAMLDATIVAWDNKAVADSERPITAIRSLFNGIPILAWGGPGMGAQLIDGGRWLPYEPAWYPTPASSEFTSVESLVAGAAAETLKRFTSSDIYGGTTTLAQGSSIVEPGITPAAPVTLSWATFSDAASQAGDAQRYGGVSFSASVDDALPAGRLVSGSAWTKARSFFDGTA